MWLRVHVYTYAYVSYCFKCQSCLLKCLKYQICGSFRVCPVSLNAPPFKRWWLSAALSMDWTQWPTSHESRAAEMNTSLWEQVIKKQMASFLFSFLDSYLGGAQLPCSKDFQQAASQRHSCAEDQGLPAVTVCELSDASSSPGEANSPGWLLDWSLMRDPESKPPSQILADAWLTETWNNKCLLVSTVKFLGALLHK